MVKKSILLRADEVIGGTVARAGGDPATQGIQYDITEAELL
jgi:hypothetical protein